MLQETAIWDMRNMISEPTTSLKLYVLFIVIVWIATFIKLIRVWRGALPFRFSRQKGSPAYLQLLETISTSLRQWIECTFLVWGFFASISLYDVCNRFLDDRVVGSLVVVFVIRDFSAMFSMALLVALFSFLVRWHVLKRIELLRHQTE